MLKTKPKGYREMVVDGVRYYFKIGRSNVKIIYSDHKSEVIEFPALTGLTWTEIERGRWKKWFAVKPAMIEHWIRHQTPVYIPGT